MSESRVQGETPSATVALIFERLFENEFATLDGIAISVREGPGLVYVDQRGALDVWLRAIEVPTAMEPADPRQRALHEAFYAALPEYDCVISGWSRHLQALLLEDMPLPRPTSMMRKRGVTDLAEHLVEPSALAGPGLAATIEHGRETVAAKDMRHLLLLSNEGMVVVAGSPPFEAMAHWHNIEFAARIACMQAEEAALIASSSGDRLASMPGIR